MLFCQNTSKTGNNAIKMSQVFHDIARRERFAHLNLFEICVQCHSKLGNGCFAILFKGAYFLSAVMVEGDESSQLGIAYKPAVLVGYLLVKNRLPAHRLFSWVGRMHYNLYK